MTKSAEAGELAERIEEFLQDVQAGNEILVTRGQQPVARLVPVKPERLNTPRSIRDLKPLDGQWIGEPVIRSGDLAEEMFGRE